MILTCPQCQTRYRTEAVNFPSTGRKVRCSKCAHVWHEVPAESDSGLVLPVVPPPPVPIVSSPAHVVSAIRKLLPDHIASASGNTAPLAEKLGLAAGWAGLIVMILLIGWIGFRFRQEIATLWPRSSSLNATFGVPVNANGIAINDWTYHVETDSGQPVMVVTGKLVNMSSRELRVPPLRISLTDNDQREIYHWNYHPPQPTLGPGASLGFVTRLVGQPPTAHLQLHFASQE